MRQASIISSIANTEGLSTVRQIYFLQPPFENGSAETSSNNNTSTAKPNKTKPKAPPVPIKYSVLTYNQPPKCPTPDYDTLSMSSNSNTARNNDAVEMDSIDSFRINNPVEARPRSPNSYFQKRDLTPQSSVDSFNTLQKRNLTSQSSLDSFKLNGSANSNFQKQKLGSKASVDSNTSKKARPVSVTIGEYPSMKRQVGKLDFLQNGGEGRSFQEKQSVVSQLASELTQTLNRSNLRRRTESMVSNFCISSY